MTIITSKSNNLIKKTKKLFQKKYRKSSYLIEGWHLFEEAKKADSKFLNIFVLEEYVDRVKEFGSVVTVVSLEILKELSESKTPQGIVAELMFVEMPEQDFTTGRYLLLEDIQDPGNLGTMIRTADAAGLDAVFISEKSADLYNAKTLRSMQGSHFHLPVYRVNLLEIVEQLNANHLPTLATTLSKDSVDYKNLENLSSFAIIMGNEGNGITPEISRCSSGLVHIKMPGQAESLNVSVACGIILFSLI